MIDKDALYGRYQKQEDKNNALALKLAHKALDIPEDMNVNAKTTTVNNNGVGPWGLAAAIGIPVASVAAVGVAALLLLRGQMPTATTPTTQPTAPAQAFDQIVEELQPDGTWKVIKREPYKP